MSLDGTVSRVSEVVFTFLGRELVEKGSDLAPDGFLASLCGLSEEVLEFGDDLLDRVQVGRVGGEE